MAGQIDFAMTMDAERMVQNTARAEATVRRFSVSALDIEKAFQRAAGSAQQSMGEVERQINRTTAATQKMAGSLSTTANARGVRSIAGSITSLGSLAAPNYAADLMMLQFAGRELKNLAEVAKFAGIGLGSTGVALGALVATVAIFAKGIEMVQAQLHEAETRRNFDAQSGLIAGRLVEFIKTGMANGQVSKGYGEDAIAQLTEKGLHPSVLRGRIKAIQETLGDVIPQATLDAAAEFFATRSRLLTSQSLEGDKKRQFDAQSQFDETTKEIRAQKGLSDAQRAALLQLAENRFQLQVRPDEKPAVVEAAKEPKVREDRFRFDPTSRLTGLERLGLVITSGVSGGGLDPQRTVAENTRQMLAEQRKTNSLLTNGNPQSFANQ